MEPRIQYAKTSDGVNIAFWTLGEGAAAGRHAALCIQPFQLEWRIPECRRWYERLAQKRARPVRRAGAGAVGAQRQRLLAGRPCSDLEAVVDTWGSRGSRCSALKRGADRPSPTRPLTRSGYPTSFSGTPMPGRLTTRERPKLQGDSRDAVGKDWPLYTETLRTSSLLGGRGVSPP